MSKTSEVSYSEGTCCAISWIKMGSCATFHISKAIFCRQTRIILPSPKLRSIPCRCHSKCLSVYTLQSAQDLFNMDFICTSMIEYYERSSFFLFSGGPAAFSILIILAANFSMDFLFFLRKQLKTSTFFSMMLTQIKIQ